MRRRALLSSLATGAAALAGCASRQGDDGTTAPQTQTTTDPPPDAGHTPEDDDLPELASVVASETVPQTYALAPTRYRSDDGAAVEVGFAATATTDHPARVRGRLTNTNDFENTFRLRQTPPFGPDNNVLAVEAPDPSYRQSLVLVPTEDHEFAENAPDVRHNANGYWRLTGDADDQVPRTVRLTPGETVEAEFFLVGRADGTGRPTGTYSAGTDEERVRVAVWHTEKSGPEDASRFDSPSVPSVSDERETQWFHAADETTPSYLRPETERADLPESVAFTFVNHTDEALECGGWNLYKLHDGEWFHVAPRLHYAVCRRLPPGGTESMTLRAFEGEAVECEGRGDIGYLGGVGHLGGGRYAVSVGFGHRTGLSAALVDLDGPPLEVTPTDDVTTARDGETVTVTSSRWGDGTEPPNAMLVVEDTGGDAVGAATEFIPEQVMRPHNRALRNTLAFFGEGVGRVVLRTDERTAERVLGDGEPMHFGYQGSVYDATIERARE